jgi:hypothetical protein
MKAIIGMAKINLLYARTPQLIATIAFMFGVITYCISYSINNADSLNLAIGNYLFLLPLCMAIFIPVKHFTKLMHLGGKRKVFFQSTFFTYLFAVIIIVLANILTRSTVDKAFVSSGKLGGTLDLFDVFRFSTHGSIISFVQMSALLLLFCCIVHTFTLIQGKWYGWIINAIIIFMILSPLNILLLWFFKIVIFNNSAIVQTLSCLAFSVAIYSTSILPIKNLEI